MTDDVRERAWDGVHDLLPSGWRVTAAVPHPVTARWTVTVVSPKYTGGRRHRLAGMGEDEVSALSDLSSKLREVRGVEARTAVEARTRAAYLQGAEDQLTATLGRPLTQDELQRVLERYR
jgi:hypothetical protein